MRQSERSVIDVDIHPTVLSSEPIDERMVERLPEPWRTRYASGYTGHRGPANRLGYYSPVGFFQADAVTPDGSPVANSPESLASYYFDRHNLEYGVLNPECLAALMMWPETDFSAAMLSAMNDIFVEEWLSTDPRFLGSLTVTTTDPELAAREIHRLGDHPQIVQVYITSGARAGYGNRIYHPIYAAAVEHNLCVAIHPESDGLGVTAPPTAVGWPTSYFEWHTDFSATFASHLVSLITEGVFKKFPTLKIVLLEGGVCWLPPLLWRLDKNWKGLRSTTPWVDRLPSEIVSEHVMLSTQPIEEPKRIAHFRQMLDMFDAEHMLMFSTDFPHWDGDTIDFVSRSLPTKLLPRVMSENARDLYGLPLRIENGVASSAGETGGDIRR